METSSSWRFASLIVFLMQGLSAASGRALSVGHKAAASTFPLTEFQAYTRVGVLISIFYGSSTQDDRFEDMYSIRCFGGGVVSRRLLTRYARLFHQG